MRFFVQGLCVVFFWSSGMVPAEGKRASFQALRDETFEAAWRQVGESYYDATFGGLDWDAVGERYRARLPLVSDEEALRKLIGEMLYELGDSHLALLSSGYDADALSAPWQGGWAGVDACYAGGRIVFYRIDVDGPAFAAGIRNGDTLMTVNGRSVRDFERSLKATGLPDQVLKSSVLSAVLSQFRTATGDQVKAVVRSPGGRRRAVEVTLVRYRGLTTEPFGRVGRMPFRFEAKRLENGCGYVSFSLWFPAAMPELRGFIGDLPADTPGLVIDLRGNPGGMMVMAGGLAGMLLTEQSELGRTTMREGYVNVVGFPQRNAFRGKVALLVDEGSVSTSEVFAIGLQELGRARVFGQRTAGAALPSVFTALPNGDSLQVALGDFRTPRGVSLEGRGVLPDEKVGISPIDLSRGRDTVLEAAVDWIQDGK